MRTTSAHREVDKAKEMELDRAYTQGQSVYDSESDFAFSIKLIVEKQINRGSTEDQIYEFLRK